MTYTPGMHPDFESYAQPNGVRYIADYAQGKFCQWQKATLVNESHCIAYAPDVPVVEGSSTTSLDTLFNLLQSSGPLRFPSTLGKGCYTVPPNILSFKLGTFSVHGWPPNSPKTPNPEHHPITVIGANKTHSHVYYIDPSDPASILVCSYKTFSGQA